MVLRVQFGIIKLNFVQCHYKDFKIKFLDLCRVGKSAPRPEHVYTNLVHLTHCKMTTHIY